MEVAAKYLRTAGTKSCGCLKQDLLRERSIKHSSTGSPEYVAWIHAKSRCFRVKDNFFADYGGRGITMCTAWKNDFSAFLADLGKRPSSKHSLDRIDVNGHYEPANCRWATTVEQANNKRTYNRLITVKGIVMTVAQASARYGISYDRIIKRLNRGWLPERAALTT